MLFCNFLQHYLVKQSFLHEEYTRGTIFLFVERYRKTTNLVLYTQIPAIPKFKCSWFALICFLYQKPICFTPIAFIFFIKGKHQWLGYLLWREDFCKLCTWTFHHSLPCFIDQYVPKGCSPFSVANAWVSSLIIETWKTWEICQRCRQMSKSVSQMLICKMCQTFFIIFLQRMWEGSNAALCSYFSFLRVVHSIFIRSGSVKLEFASVCFLLPFFPFFSFSKTVFPS